MCDRFKLYIIYSNRKLKDILQLLINSTSSPSEIGPLRKDFIRNVKTGEYREIDRRYVILSDDVFNDLVKSGLTNESNTEFFIEEFTLCNENKAPKDSLMHFYFPYSNNNKKSISDKLIYIQSLGIFSSDDYFVHDGVVEFSSNVSKYTKIIIKIILDNIDCRVSWCRKGAFNNIKHKF